jgi:hypothetical protein
MVRLPALINRLRLRDISILLIKEEYEKHWLEDHLIHGTKPIEMRLIQSILSIGRSKIINW